MNERKGPHLTEAEAIARMKDLLPQRRHAETAQSIMRARSEGHSPTSDLPGFDQIYMRSLLGELAWGRLRVAEDIHEEGEADASTTQVVTASLTINGISTGYLDDQRIQITHRSEASAMGKNNLSSIQIKAKRQWSHDILKGSLSNLRMDDGVTLPFVGIELLYRNPTLNSSTHVRTMILDRIRFLLSPSEAEKGKMKDAIAKMNAHVEGNVKTYIGSWHDFLKWQIGDYIPSSADYNLPFDTFSAQSEALQTGREAAVQVLIDNKQVTSTGDPTAVVSVFDTQADDHITPGIQFRIPAQMTYL